MKKGVDSRFHRTFLFALISVGNFLEHKTPKSSLQNKNVLPKNEKSMYNEANTVENRHIYRNEEDCSVLIFRKNKGQQQYSDNQYGFFWQTMQLCDWDQEGNDMLVLKPVIEFLSKQKDRKIFLFHDMMSELLYALNTRELAAQCKKAYALMTDDSFLYSRCVALINGPEYYANVKAGLCKDLWTMEFEAVLYVPLEAWARKHGKEPEDYPHEPPFSYETESNADGWK